MTSPLIPVPRAAGDHLPADETPAFDWGLVETALTRTTDARDGFQRMQELAEPGFAPTVARFLDLHRRHSDRIARLMAEAGRVPDADGSLMGRVNRLVVSARALVDRIDADTLPQIVSGETHVLEAYDAALAGAAPQGVRDELAALRDDLADLLATVSPPG